MDWRTMREAKSFCTDLPSARFWGLIVATIIVAVTVAFIFACFKWG